MADFLKIRLKYIFLNLGSGDSNPNCLSTEFSQSLPPCWSWRASARLHPYAPKFFAKIQPSRCSQFHISNFFCNKVNYAGNTVVFSRDLLPLQGKLLCETNVGLTLRCLLVNTLANVLAEKLDTQSAALAAAIFTQLGDTLATIAVADASNDQSDG